MCTRVQAERARKKSREFPFGDRRSSSLAGVVAIRLTVALEARGSRRFFRIIEGAFVQIAMGLGVAALSVLAGLDSSVGSDSSPGEVRPDGEKPVASEPTQADSEISVRENSNVWFNLAHVEFLGTNGDWYEEDIDEGVVLLQPANDECSFGVRLLWSKEIVYFPMDEESELAFDGEWLKVDQTGSGLSILERRKPDGTAMSAAGAFAQECDFEMDASEVGTLSWGGSCWVEEETPSPNCMISAGCGGSAEDSGGCGVSILMVNGTSATKDYFESECGGTITVTECMTDTGRRRLCIDGYDGAN